MGRLFKFLNFLSRDILRNYLACGVGLNITNCIDYLELCDKCGYTPNSKELMLYLRKSRKALDDVFAL